MDGTLVEEQQDLSFTLGDGDVIQVQNFLCQNSCIDCLVVVVAVVVPKKAVFSRHQYNLVQLVPIQALDLTVQLMEMGEKALIQTDSKYAYGSRGRQEDVLNCFKASDYCSVGSVYFHNLKNHFLLGTRVPQQRQIIPSLNSRTAHAKS